ncbi:MAG TPA: glycoside hydrolase family 3 N-terminal domain-containing protein [Aggregatilineales bacterium]|nr:hypothetical protein [Anaerolineales bacterium]HRE47624.1 glycoside hydrolase family 3 N-terminal domain-containing protein [Aggregatilineales bacterium]
MRQFMHSFVGYTPPPDVLRGVESGQIAAFCLFRDKNVLSPSQLRDLSGSLYRAAKKGGHPSPLIAIDQEGGQLVAITGGATELPGNMALGATRSSDLAFEAGRLLGRELLAMGITMNLAPCLDVNVNPANPVIGIRSFGDDPELVGTLGAAFVRGQQSVGVLAVAKHFPGHGDTATDPHHDAAIIQHNLERVRRVEFPPFVAAIEAGVAGIMTAHLHLTNLDPDLPATLSPRILQGVLRGELGFGGLIVTDAMDMGAVARYGTDYSIQQALYAGADVILLGHLEHQIALAERMGHLANPESLRRIADAQAHLPTTIPPLEVIGSPEHLHTARQIAERSITVVRGLAMPINPAPDETLVVITPRPVNLTPADTSASVEITLGQAIRRRHPRTLNYELATDGSNLADILAAAAVGDTVIVGTLAAENDPFQAELVRALHVAGKNPLVIAMRTPYDLAAFPMIETYLCCYGIRAVTLEAVARVIFGEIKPVGILPCAIPLMM